MQDKVLVPVSLSSLLYLWGLSQLGVACMPGTIAWSIARSEQMGTACVNGVFPEGGSHGRVAGATGINSFTAQPGFVAGALISSWQTDCVLNVDAGSSIPNISTWEVFLEYQVPFGVSIMTLLPVLLNTWEGIRLNGVENFFFLSLTSTWSPTWISDCFVFLALSVHALVFSFTLTSLYVAISLQLWQFCQLNNYNSLDFSSSWHDQYLGTYLHIFLILLTVISYSLGNVGPLH